MQKLDDWRELLGKITNHNPTERERIANELGVRSITLTRWANGESVPRSYYLRELVNVLPQQDRALLSESLEQEFPGVLSALSPDDPSGELPYQIVDEVLTTRATNPDPLRFWAMSRLVLQHALRQLDPECMGMAITLVRWQTYFAGFRQRVRKRMQESLTTQHPLKLTLAERLVWQELEEIFLQLPHPAT